MKHYESGWQSADGIQFYAQGWEPEGETKAVICLVHGIGEHCGRYAHVAEFLGQAGYALSAFDLRGHGKSGGQRGHSPSFDVYMDDIARSLELAAQRYPGKPCFLYGHSLGGLLVINFALRRKPQLRGVVATSPALRTAVEKQVAKVWMARILGTLFPTLSMATALDVAGLSHDGAVIQRYQHDPLVHGVATLAMAKGSIESIPWVFAHAAEFPLPLLLVHGSQDPITYPDGSRDFAALVPGNCTFKLWEGLYHETHNEPQKEQVLGFMVEWLNSKL